MKQQTLEIKFEAQSVKIPYFVFQGKLESPHIFISGGIHGDEINGIALVEKFMRWAEKNNIEKKLEGRITVLPVLNPNGFSKAKRYINDGKTDLNRQFKLKKPTSFGETITHELTEKILKNCTLGIDCHDAGVGASLVPHVRIHKDDHDNCISCSREIGQIFGTKILLERQGHSNMMAIALKRKYNIPIVTVEIGGGKIINEDFLETGLQGIKNTLYHLGMLKGEIKIPKKQFILFERYGFKAPEAGIVRLSKELGNKVHADEKIGEFFSPITGKTTSLVSNMCGMIFSHWEFNQVSKGDVIYSVLESEKCHVERTTTEKFMELKPINIKH